jgi:hypothetical protein
MSNSLDRLVFTTIPHSILGGVIYQSQQVVFFDMPYCQPRGGTFGEDSRSL